MPTKKEELEKLRSYLMGLPVVQTQIKLRSELSAYISGVCKKHNLKDKHTADIRTIAEHWALGNCTLPDKWRGHTGPHITDFIFSAHPATKNKRSAWDELKPWLREFHSRYYGDPPTLSKIHIQIKNTFFVLYAEYGIVSGWLERVSKLKAEYFSDGVYFYRVRERGIPHDRSVNAKTLERAEKKK